MSASQNSHPEKDDDLFDEPDYDQFSDEELDALYRGESLDSVRASKKAKATATSKINVPTPSVDDDIEVAEIDPELERELRAELDDDGLEDDWDSVDDELDNL